MAFEDSLIGNGDDFDPSTAMDALIRQQSAEPLPDTLDPRMLNARLARKLNQPAPPPVEVDLSPAPKPAMDFSSQGIEPPVVDPKAEAPDFSSMGVEPTVVSPTAAPAAPTFGTYAKEAAKGVAEGFKGMGASSLKGIAAVVPEAGAQPDYDILGNPLGTNDAMETGAKPKPMEERLFFRAGKAVDEFGKEALAPAKGFEGSWTRDIGAGFGSMLAGIPVALIPGVGPLVGASLYTTAGMGEAVEKAVKEKASDSQAESAGIAGAVAGATDLVDVMLPFMGRSTGRALGFIKRVGLGAIKGAMAEGGQEGLQQLIQNAIAKGIYKPDQDLFEDVPRSMAIAAIVGGTVAGGGAAIGGSEPATPTAPAAPGAAPGPTPGVGTGPGAGPSGGPQSSPEDIADFVRRAREGAPDQSGADAQPRDPASMSEAERLHAYNASRASHGGASEAEILKAAGFDPATMDEQDRIDAVIRAAKKPDATGNAQGNAPGNAEASGPQQEGLKPKEEASHLHYAVLREAGYSDEDIDDMSPRQRAREFKDAVAEGIKPGAAMMKHPKRKPKPAESATTSPDDVTAERPVDTGLGFGNLGNAGKDIGDSLRDHLWGRVEAGELSEGKGMGQSALLQGAKMIRERGGFTDRKDFDAYANEQSKLTPGTPEFQQGMRDLVAKYSRTGQSENTPGDTGQNAPESRATLKAQQNQLIKGERVAQMFPKGTREMPLPPGMERVETERGIFHFDPKKVTADGVKAISAAGRENELLGLGSFSKEDIAGRDGPDLTIVERDANGTEIRAAVGKPSTVQQQLAEMEKGKGEGNTVAIEHPQHTLDKRRSLEGMSDEAVFAHPKRLLKRLFDEDGQRITEITIAADRKTKKEHDDFGLTAMQGGQKLFTKDGVDRLIAEQDRREALRATGKSDAPIDIKTAADVEATGKVASGDYTHAQGEANNRQLGHAKWNEIPVKLEVAKGGVRKMLNPETGEGVDVTHAGAAYGYFPGTVGADKMAVDIYMGEHPESSNVYVIDEIDRDTKKFRQHKVMAGFTSERDAFAAYVGTSTKGPETVGAITTMSVPELKAWLAGDTTKALKPASLGPDKTGEAGSSASTEAAVASPAVPKGSPDASLGGKDDGVRPEATNTPDRGKFQAETRKSTGDSDIPLSILQFIASRGGLRPDPELNAIGLAGDHRVQIPGRKGFFGIIKATGDSLDNMREAAEEAGYLRGEHNKTSTVRDFLDAIDTEMRGGEHRAEGEEGKTTKRQRTSLKEASDAARDKAIIENVESIKAEYAELPDGLAEQAAAIMADEMLDIDSAVEMAAVRAVNEDADYEINENDIVATYGEGVHDAIQPRPASEDGRDTAPTGDQEQRSDQGEEAIEDGEPDAPTRAEGGEGQVARPYPYTADRTQPTQIVPLPMELSEFEEITDEWAELFSDPAARINLETKLKNGPFIPLEEAQARIDQWRADAAAQAENGAIHQANANKTILSLYDLTGNWARPWAEAGYNVLTFDIQSGHDVNDFSVEYFTDNWDITDVYGILIAQPCTDFATSGSKHFAAKDARGDTAKSIELVHQSLRTVEYFRPKFWVLENPVSRIEKLTGLPKWQLLFNPNNFGDPYTKKTVLWGKFNAELPTANVDPVEGSKMWAKYGGKSQATKNARSATPEGFAYAFFKANNYADRTAEDRLPDDYPEVSGAVLAALKAGVTEDRINELMEDTYGNYEYDEARDALIKEVYGVDPIAAKAMAESEEPLEGEIIEPYKPSAEVVERARNLIVEPPPYTIDNEPAGEQRVLPGAERIGQGEQAQRRADQGLKPTKPQKAMDDGLFGDSMNQIELVLGPDADRVAPVDIARAAEIMAENPGMEPATAFGQAVIETAVEQGFITEQQAEEAYGPEVIELLESERERASLRGGDVEQERAGTDEIGAGDAAQDGEFPGGGEVGPAEGGADTRAQDRELNDTAGTEPDAGREAGNPAAQEGADGAKAARNPVDAPTWAQVLHALPKDAAGHYDVEYAFRIMSEITGERQPAYRDLTPEQRYEVMDRLVPAQKEPIIKAEDNANGVPPPVPTSDAPASPEAVQPVEPGGQADGLRGREGSGGEPAVPRADRKRAEGAGRVSEGARGERSDRTGDGGDARLPEGSANDAADGRAKRADRPASNVEGENFVIEPGALDEGRGQKQKARDNIKAIAAMQLIEMEGRHATAAEQADLSKYVGWGGIKNIFPDAQGNFAEDFAELGAKLRGLLSDEEYTTARRSIQYAHYTAEDVVRSMWDAVAKMGFTGGQVFEPGMGVGNFAGMMPADIAANSHYQGIELDHVTARIAKLLYPKYGVRQDDFTKTKLPENSYDLVIGNPPFADVAIKSDPKYKQGFLLHDYFFAKSLDAVRPGGLLAFVTSAGTMNKLDTAAREYLADRADLAGAIRLPGDAFAKNAGTMVTTDIIFLRKRLPGDVAGDRTWTETKVVSLPGMDGSLIEGNVNRYISEHPEMVIGKPDFNDRLYPGRYSVKMVSGQDFKADLARAIDKLPADIMRPWQDVNTEQHQHDFDTTEKKEGTYYVGPDGSLHQVANGVGQKVGQRGKGVENGRTAADMERIKALIPVRDALRQVYAFDLKGDTGNAERARAGLNKAYDGFVAVHGPINKSVIQTRRPNVIQMEAARDEAREAARYAGETFKEGTFDATPMIDAKMSTSVIARERQKAREEAAKSGLTFDEGDFDIDEVPDVIIDKRPNVDPFMDDPESYRLRAIEKYDEGTGIGHKSDVFFKNVISREVTPKISSVHDGLLYSLSQYGRVNVPAIAELTKKSEAEVIDGLGEQVFKTPGTKDTFVTRDEYLSGNVRKKLELAQKAADRNPEFRRNVSALEAAQPMPLAPSQIHAGLGMPWIPQAVIEKFALDEMGLEKIRVRYQPKLASWTVSGDTDSVAAQSTWGTADRRAPSLLQSALNRQTVKVYDEIRLPDGGKSSVLNVAKTEAANDKLMQMRSKFSEWIWADQERADTLAAYYNETYNNLVVREYDGSYLTTPGIAAHWSWRPHQKRVIARVIQSGNTYIAHAVGGGKTSEYIGAIMEMRRLGLVRKPMVAVPNHMLAQFTKEWYEQYPTARLAIADDKRFHTDKRKQFIANVAMDDLDAIIITHSSFGMIPVSPAFENSIIEREIASYREVLAEIKKDGSDNRITRSRVEKQIERLEQRLVSRKGRKDATFTFEEMGVDHLTIDEAHLFRKLDFTTAMSNLKGISPDGSQAAWDLYIKSQYLNSIRPGRGLVLGSGTPITNTMAELWSLSRYMQPEALAERGLEKFDAWAGAFGESVSELEQNAAGEYKAVSRFAKFVNVAELSAMVRQVMDVVTGKQLEQYVPRPQLKGGKRQFHLAEKSREQARFVASLGERMKAIAARKGPPAKGDDIMLSVINDGRHASIDMRLAGGDRESTPSKLDLMVDNAFEIWKASKRQPFHKIGKDGKYEAKPAMSGPATQLLFVNLGLSGARGFSVPDYIRAELVRRGVPKSDIAYIYDYKSATAKQRLFNDMNEGKVRILIGSVAKMGVGTNVQRRLLATHNMDPLWYPADDEQRVGRIIRQGNMNPEVQVHDYSTKGTYDSTMWGMMEKKARFIQGFFEGDPSLRDMEDLGEASQYEQAKALTTSDPRLIRFTELKQELERANRRKTAFDSDVYNTRQNRQKSKAQIEHYAQRIEDTKKDIKQRLDTRAEAFKGTVGKETFDKRADFGVALFERIGQVEDSGSLKGGIKVATVGGFDIYATAHKSNLIKDHTNVDVFMALNGNATREVSFDTSSLGTVRSIESILHGFDSDLVEYQHRLDKASKFFRDSESKANARFEGDADIAALKKQVDDLAAELAKPVEEAPAAPVEGDELADTTGGLSEEALASEQRISAMLTDAVRAVAGDSVTVEFVRGAFEMENVPGYAAERIEKAMARGGYLRGKSLIKLSLTDNADNMLVSAYHEAYHHVEDKLQTPAERELMKRETPRMRKTIKGRTKLTDAQVDALAGYEVRAIAASLYGYDRARGMHESKAGEGLHIGVRRWFERLFNLLQRIKNGLNGLGFKTYKDIFNDVYDRKFAGRKPTPGGINPESMAATEETELAGLRDAVTLVADRIQSKFGERFTEMRVKIQDKFIRVRHMQDSFGAKPPTSQDTYQAEELLPGRTGYRLEDLEKNKFEPLVEAMAARNIALEEMSDFLYALHAPARNAEMDRINHPNLQGMGGRNMQGRGSGMSDQEAADILHRLGNRRPDFDALLPMVRDIQQGTVDTLVDYGLISQDTADAWAATYPDGSYVPLMGFDEAFEDDVLSGMNRGIGLDTRAAESKRAFGRLSKAAGPLPYIMIQAELAIVRGEKNRVGNTFLKFVRAHPDPSRWTVNKPEVKPAIDPRTGLVTMVADNQWHNDPNAFVTKVGGKITVIRLQGKEGEQLARALKNMGVESVGEMLRFFRAVTVTMARLSTQWNPNFVLPNLVRDLGEAYINLQEQDQQRFVKQFTKHIIPAIGGSFQALRGGNTGRYAQAFHEFDAAGGRIRFFGLDNAVDVEKSIRRQMRRLQGGPVATIQEAGKKLADGFDTVNSSIENATRLAAYMAARDVGMSIPDSAKLALNLTVNFTKGGELRPIITSMWMFANAGVQGGRRTFSALKNKNVRRANYALIGLGILSAMLGYGMGGDDDSGESYYDKVPEWERDKNVIIMWPKGYGRDGGYAKIMLPFLFAVPKVLGERLVAVALGKAKPLDAAGSVIKAFLDGLNPLGQEGGSSLSPLTLLPSFTRPAAHIMTNQNWNGRQIYPERQYEKNKPESEQSFSTTPEYAKSAARGLNRLGGGSAYKSSGALDVHPGTIQHILESLTGGLGKFVGDVAGTANRAWKGEPFDVTKAPVARRFVGSTNTEESDQRRYWDDREEARKNGGDAIKNARSDRAKGVNKDEADSFLKDNTNSTRGEQIFKNADEAMKPLRERKSRIEASDSFTDEQRQEVETIKQRMRDIQNRARKSYRELKAGAS